jgi:transcriptional regulator with AAA-type ATPase domain
LYGHAQGALTGAGRYRIRKFEQSQGGTILLDGIDDMPLALQAREYNSGARLLGQQTLSPGWLTC